MPGNIFLFPPLSISQDLQWQASNKKMNEWMNDLYQLVFFCLVVQMLNSVFSFSRSIFTYGFMMMAKKKTRFIMAEFEEKSECENRYFFVCANFFFHSLFLSAWLIRWSLTKKKIAIFKILKNKNHVCACVCFFYSCMLQLFLISILNTIYMWKILWIYIQMERMN